MNKNIQCTQIPNLYAWNNPWWFDIPWKSISLLIMELVFDLSEKFCEYLLMWLFILSILRDFFFFFAFTKNYAGYCWRSRDELISDVLLWTPTHSRAKAGRPARTYIQQVCEDTGCWPEDLPRAMNDREKWRERVRDTRANSTTWRWWWFINHYSEFYP